MKSMLRLKNGNKGRMSMKKSPCKIRPRCILLCHGGLRILGQAQHRVRVRGGADEDVSEIDGGRQCEEIIAGLKIDMLEGECYQCQACWIKFAVMIM